MVQFQSVHYAPPRSRPSKVQFRQLFQTRALTVAIPLVACLIFSGMYGVQHAHSVAVHNQAINKTSQRAAAASSSSNPKSSINQGTNTDQLNSTSLPTANPSTKLPATGTPITPAPSITKTLPGSSLQQATATVCDLSAKTVATTTEQTALTLENTRHTAKAAVLEADNLTSLLVTGKDSPAMTAENNLHAANLQKIDNTYRTSLADDNCL